MTAINFTDVLAMAKAGSKNIVLFALKEQYGMKLQLAAIMHMLCEIQNAAQALNLPLKAIRPVLV